jgi:hypothetical protein
MAKLRASLYHYAPIFGHGLVTGVLAYLTFMPGNASG